MSPEKFQLLMDLFQRALAIEGAERRRFIDQRCGEDIELRQELEALLGEPSESQAQLVTAGGLEAVRRNVSPEPPTRSSAPAPVLSGNYRLLRVLGEGGMGIVYQAEQAFPRRVVALKAMRSGFVSRSLLRRFQNEAQLLARLQHPGIAQIYEAGAADEEHPDQAFFAMEFVDGRPLTDFASERQLTVAQRLELMARVCDAVQHAHQRGVIHRDLKPSNILVDVTADPPQPKVLDFGVARATDGDLRSSTAQTGIGQLVGTLPYMSPEQVSADPDAVDTRTDVYALGVVLYQLLTGRLPFDVSSRSIPDAVRMIRDEAPSRLSTIDRALRGDLETIVAKAIEKDKDRRYQSAAELGDDLRRFLRREPIAAKRDSLGYLLQKRVRRYRWAVAASVGFVIVLTGFLIHAILQARELADRLSIANVERGRALAEGGSLAAAGDVLWREFLQKPEAMRTRWALREYYERHPVLCTIPDSDVQPSEIALSPDGQWVAVCGIRGRSGVFAADLSKTRWERKVGPETVAQPFFTADGRHFGMIADGRGVILVDAETGELARELAGQQADLRRLALSPDGALLAASGLDGHVGIYDLASGRQLVVKQLHPVRTIHELAFASDGKSLFIGGSDRTLARYPLDLEAPEWLVKLESGVAKLVPVEEGRVLAVALTMQPVLWVESTSGQIIGQTRCSSETLVSLTPISDNRLAAGGPGFLDILDIPSRSVVRTLTSDRSHSFVTAPSPKPDVLVVGGVAAALQLWQIDPEASHKPIGTTPAEWTLGLAAAKSGSPLLTVDNGGGIQLWDLVHRRPQTPRILSGLGNLRAGAITADGRQVFLGGANGSVHVRSGEDLSEIRSFPCFERAITGLDVSPDGRYVVACAFDGQAGIWDAQTGARLHDFGVCGRQTTFAKFSPDGTRVVLSGFKPSLSLWDVQTGKQLASVDNDGNAFAIAFSPDGRWLAATGRMRRVDMLDSWTLRPIFTLEGHSHVPVAMAVSPDGQMVAAGAADGVVRFWDAKSGGALATIRLDTQEVSRLLFTPDGRELLATGRRGRIWAYQLDYHDRAIAGNARFQAARQRDWIPRSTDTQAVLRWADGMMATDAKAMPAPTKIGGQ